MYETIYTVILKGGTVFNVDKRFVCILNHYIS